MARYNVNKGVGRSVEVKGLRAQYFIYAVIGIVVAFIVFFILSFIAGQIIAVIIAAACLICNVSVCFYLNNKYGEKGLGHLYANMLTPSRVASHKRIHRIPGFKDGKKEQKY